MRTRTLHRSRFVAPVCLAFIFALVVITAARQFESGVTVADAAVRVYRDPNRAPLATLSPGILEHQGEWLRISFRDRSLGDRMGFVRAAHVRTARQNQPAPPPPPNDPAPQPPGAPTTTAKFTPNNEVPTVLTRQLGLPGRRVVVHLRVDQDGGLTETQLGQAVNEVGRIWRRVGVDVSYERYSRLIVDSEATVALDIVRTPPSRTDRGFKLAWVVLDPAGKPLPTLFVSIAAVTELLSDAEYLDHVLLAWAPTIQSRLIARGIGRVIAHELGHYLQGVEHAASGLMSSRYLAKDLLGDSLLPFEVPIAGQIAIRREVGALAERQATDRANDRNHAAEGLREAEARLPCSRIAEVTSGATRFVTRPRNLPRQAGWRGPFRPTRVER